MMKMKTSTSVLHAPSFGRTSDSHVYATSSTTSSSSSSSSPRDEGAKWEMRPGGMLVQKRVSGPEPNFPSPNLRLRVAFGAVRLDISVSSQATFGEVKTVLAAETGLRPGEQRLIFRGRERGNGEFLDNCGVKDRSKLVLTEDPVSIELRFVETRRNARIQSAHRAISDISLEVDKLADQVAAIETSVSKGVKVSEVQITTLIEMLMRHAIKLDAIPAEGDASAQKNLHGKRVQKCVETLDVMKISNARLKPVLVTTKWETFDPLPTTTHWEIFD